MNIRKKVDYSEMYVALDNAVAGAYSQMQMYAQIGKAVSSREEKGAAVAAAEYLQEQYPNIPGFLLATSAGCENSTVSTARMLKHSIWQCR